MMGRYRNEHFNLFQLIAIVFMCRVTCGCAAVPDELEGLAGQVLRGSDVQDSKTSDSVSFIQPVEDKEDLVLHGSISKETPINRISSSIFSLDFIHGFLASLSVIIVSELGDKTFFIAAIMSMRHSRLVVFSGAMCALGLMTVLSAVLGFATTVIPRKYTLYISTALFVVFGLKMLKEGYEMDPNEGQEELEEVQAELKKKEAELEKDADTITQDVETGIIRGGKSHNKFFGILSPILLQAFTLTFLAEWGDRSQIATILLASRENVAGVTIGGILGHSLCTGLAVIGGRLIAQRISVRTVTIVGGIVFLIFAVTTFFIDE
ncbi:putative divalent cation/proton antiporter TMEM165 [Montipora foliosa]|uniref:putative divalent cation/proton antiporter TMEM165 n=1 Tax=Montipora foliosa TaxID=591990 RepID=UPI0035F13126